MFEYVFPSVGMSVRMYASLTPERFDGFDSYSVLKSLSIIGRYPVNIKVLEPGIVVIRIGLKKQMTVFSKTFVNI
jgi:hypothetical protein